MVEEHIESMATRQQEQEKRKLLEDFDTFVENFGLDVASALYANKAALETFYELLDAYKEEKQSGEMRLQEMATMYAIQVQENIHLQDSNTALMAQIEQYHRELSLKDMKTALWMKSVEAEMQLLKMNKSGNQASGAFNLTADCRSTDMKPEEMAKLELIDNLKDFHAALISIKDVDKITINLSKHMMLPVIFETLRSSALDIPLIDRIIAGACVGQLLRLAPVNCTAAMRPLLMRIPHAVLDTLPLFEEFLYRAVHGRFTDIKHATLLAKTFAATTQTYINIIADDVSTAKLLMKAMLAVAAYPAMDVASASYGFWSKLHHTLISANAAAMDSAAQHKMEFFDSQFKALIAKIVESARMPTSTANWTKDDWQRFSELRNNLGAIMLSLAGFLGMHTVLSTLLEPIIPLASQPPGVPADTRSAEAALHAVASMFAAPHSALLSTPYEDETLLILFNQLPRLPHDKTLHNTGLVLTSAAAAWLAGAFQATEMGAHLESNLISFISDVLVSSPIQSAAQSALCALRKAAVKQCLGAGHAAEDGYESDHVSEEAMMTASEVSSEASEQDTYSASELDVPDKERSDYEAAVYQGWQGSLFKTSSPTAAPQVDSVYLGWAGRLFNEKTARNMGSSNYEVAVVEDWDGTMFAPSSPSAAYEKASIREETLTQQRLAAMAEGTHQDLAKEWGRSPRQPQPVPYLQAIIDCPSALTFSLDVHTRHTNTTSTINTEAASKKRCFSQKAKQWISIVKTKAAVLFSCLAPKAAE